MKKFVADRKCFINVGEGKARLVKKGEVITVDDDVKLPSYFRELPKPKKGKEADMMEEGLDFEGVGEQELLENPAYTVKALRAYAEETYGVKLKGTSKEDVVASFLDARFRHLEEHETEGVL